MQTTNLKMSLNSNGEIDSTNPVVRFAKSKVCATMLLCVSLLWPFESFSANCQLTAAPVCVDSSPGCRDVMDSNGQNVFVCLSNVAAPVGALVTAQTCWQYKAAYNCMNQLTPSYNDTCAAIKNGGSCANYVEKSVVCNPNIPLLAGGACALFDVTYQCDVSPGAPYSETTCNTTTSCVDANGNPSFCTGPVTQERNKAFGLAVAGNETARQAGVYLDPGAGEASETDITKLNIFKGEFARCSEGMWGYAPNCCKPEGKGADVTNALIAQEVLGAAWNQIAKATVGTEYVYDTLLDKTIDLLDKGITAITNVYNGATSTVPVVASTTNNLANAGGAVATAGAGNLTNVSGGIGGYVGGQFGGAAGSYIAVHNGANTGWAGTLSAAGTFGGSVAGTYAGAYAGSYAGTVIDLPPVFRLPTGGAHATCFSCG